MRKGKNLGQISLMFLTAIGVVLTLVLSVSSRVLTEVQITEKEEESAQAFSAAEAGIEEALKQLSEGSAINVNIDPSELDVDSLDVDFSVSGSGDTYVYPRQAVNPGETVVIWLCNHDTATGQIDEASCFADASIYACWENDAAVEVLYFYDNGGDDYRMTRSVYDPNTGRRATNNFSDVDPAADDCAGLDVGAEVAFGGEPLFLAIRPFYNRTRIGAEHVLGSSEDIPGQGYEIYSTGSVAGDEKDVARRIRVFRGWSTPPQSFFSGIFAGNGVSGD